MFMNIGKCFGIIILIRLQRPKHMASRKIRRQQHKMQAQANQLNELKTMGQLKKRKECLHKTFCKLPYSLKHLVCKILLKAPNTV